MFNDTSETAIAERKKVYLYQGFCDSVATITKEGKRNFLLPKKKEDCTTSA